MYGAEQQLKVERVNEMIEGYRNFSSTFEGLKNGAMLADGTTPVPAFASSSASAASGGSRFGLQRSESLKFDQPTLEALQILFNKDGNYVQQLVVDEAVKM